LFDEWEEKIKFSVTTELTEEADKNHNQDKKQLLYSLGLFLTPFAPTPLRRDAQNAGKKNTIHYVFTTCNPRDNDPLPDVEEEKKKVWPLLPPLRVYPSPT